MKAITKSVARKVLTAVDAGLVRGLGVQIPGQMCIEAAVCFALGLPHSDNPPCVGHAVRSFKIRLNDSRWSSDKARAKGMRKIAVAQLGSDTIDQVAFVQIIAGQTIRQIIPRALRFTASWNPKHAEALEASAKRCEDEGTKEAAREAAQVARLAAAAATDAATYAAATYAAAADAAAYAADAAAYAAATAAYAAAYAAATYAADAAAYAAATYAADAAAYAAATYAADAAARDEILALSAEICLQALIDLKSPGCKFLSLCE